MIYLQLFLTFLKIGAVSFGGGYGMIPLIREEVLGNGWMEEDTLLQLIAVSESTPGPLAVNMATFIGSTQGGFLGSLLATVGVVLPAFFIILLIASILKNVLRYRGVQATLEGIRPATAALVTGTAVVLLLGTLFNISSVCDVPEIDGRGLIILCLLFAVDFMGKRRMRPLSPIGIILLSALLGLLLYS